MSDQETRDKRAAKMARDKEKGGKGEKQYPQTYQQRKAA